MNYGAKWGLATHPKKLHSLAIKRLLNRALWEQGIRQNPLPAGVKRHEWKTAHGYRKFYKSRAEQVMKPINVEATMGHDLGISQSYWKPTEREVLKDYLKAVDLLTINDAKSTLQKQMVELTEKNKEENLNIKGKLAEREKEFEAMKARQATFEERTNSQIEKLFQVVVEFIARENNLNRDDPEDVKTLRHSMNEALNSTDHYFGHRTFLKGKDLSFVWKKKQ